MTVEQTRDGVTHDAPLILKGHQLPDRFYLGGQRIAEFRDEPGMGERAPEDWIASTTELAGEPTLGLTVLDDGSTLRDLVVLDPLNWLGPDHVAAFGSDTRLLVKLLNPAQRLPVHAHPDLQFASRHLARAHGKAEAWSIIDGGDIHLGLKAALPRQDLLTLVRRQDPSALLGLLHRRAVRTGDIVFVPPGTLHAIGSGVFLAEVQEPEDLSILLEWHGFDLDGPRDGHLGLGFDTAIDAIDLTALSEGSLDALISRDRGGTSRLVESGIPYFRLSRESIAGARTLERGFAVLIIEQGEFELEWGGGTLAVHRGHTLVVPYSGGELRLAGTGIIIESRPPLPPTTVQ
jgi:mannose-6-phosphate isomerase